MPIDITLDKFAALFEKGPTGEPPILGMAKSEFAKQRIRAVKAAWQEIMRVTTGAAMTAGLKNKKIALELVDGLFINEKTGQPDHRDPAVFRIFNEGSRELGIRPHNLSDKYESIIQKHMAKPGNDIMPEARWYAGESKSQETGIL